MTPEEFKTKLEELRAMLTERLADLKKDPKWGTDDEREELVEVLEEVGDQIEDLSEALQIETHGGDADDDD
jgi:hypothetical protein